MKKHVIIKHCQLTPKTWKIFIYDRKPLMFVPIEQKIILRSKAATEYLRDLFLDLDFDVTWEEYKYTDK